MGLQHVCWRWRANASPSSHEPAFLRGSRIKFAMPGAAAILNGHRCSGGQPRTRCSVLLLFVQSAPRVGPCRPQLATAAEILRPTIAFAPVTVEGIQDMSTGSQSTHAQARLLQPRSSHHPPSVESPSTENKPAKRRCVSTACIPCRKVRCPTLYAYFTTMLTNRHSANPKYVTSNDVASE